MLELLVGDPEGCTSGMQEGASRRKQAGAEADEGRRKARGGRGSGGQVDVDMEVTFASGLETLGERLAAKRAPKAAHTVWEHYIQRRRCPFCTPKKDHLTSIWVAQPSSPCHVPRLTGLVAQDPSSERSSAGSWIHRGLEPPHAIVAGYCCGIPVHGRKRSHRTLW